MPARTKHSLSDFPKPGSVFAMPLSDGRVGVCRVLRLKNSRGQPAALVATSDWIADQAPALNDPAVRRILVLSHHHWAGRPELIWVLEPPPQQFRKIGEIEVLAKDRSADSVSYGAWDSLPIQVLAQWRWDHDRPAVLREDAAQRSANTEMRTKATRDRAAFLSSLSLADFVNKDLFPRWEDYPPKAAKAGCQRAIQEFIHVLSIERSLTEPFVVRKLQACIEELNLMDSRKPFIATLEREDLYGVFEEILTAAGFPALLDRIDEWRNW